MCVYRLKLCPNMFKLSIFHVCCMFIVGVAAYPLTLLSASVKAMNHALALLKSGERTDDLILPFKDLQAEVGFEEYYKDLHKYL